MTRRLVVYRGLPGAGKTTDALALQRRLRARGVAVARLGRDVVRGVLGIDPGASTPVEEQVVTVVQAAMMTAAWTAGADVVIVDDTNLYDAHLRALVDHAHAHGAGVEVRDLRHVDVATCVRRDARRSGSARVGQGRLRDMAAAAGLDTPTSTGPGARRRRSEAPVGNADDEEAMRMSLPDNHVARLDGRPGLVWYSRVTPTRGVDLRVGQWLDSLDHRGARMIFGLRMLDVDDPMIEVTFSMGDVEIVRRDVVYDVVDPDSQVTPDGRPVTAQWPDDAE